MAAVLFATGQGCGGGFAASGSSASDSLTDVELDATAPEVDSSRIPPGRGWWCFEARTGQLPALVGCDRTKDQCEAVRFEYQGNVGAGVTTNSCQPAAHAYCYTFWEQATRRYQSSCHGDELSCGRNRSQARQSPVYRLVSPCAEVE
jgi:hypothetical protein